MMAESLAVSPISDRSKTRNAFIRMKSCSPKFRTVLRQRYKERVENNRFRLLNELRHINCDEDLLSKSNKVDCCYFGFDFQNSLAKDDFLNKREFNLDEELFFEEVLSEELTQFENWLLQEYESLWCEEENDEIIITCPLCCSGQFEFVDSRDGKILCRKCNSAFLYQRSLLDLQNDIFNEVDKHNSQCCSNPAFVNVPSGETLSNLCIACNSCGYLQVII